jgi:hypothetical protein
MAWTTPALCGAAALVSSGDATFFNYTNPTIPDASSSWGGYNFSTTDVTGDTMKYTNWDIEIPGAGANVSRMKITVRGNENIPIGGFDLNINGRGITINEQTVDASGQVWAMDTVDLTIAEWGLTETEINNLVSNSATYGFEIDMFASQWSNSTCSIKDFYLSFEYTQGRRIFIA